MEVVDVLRDHIYIEIILKVFEDLVGGVGLYGGEGSAAVVVELMYERRVAHESVVAGHFHHVVVFPQAVGVAESADTALGAYSGACRYHEFELILCHRGRMKYCWSCVGRWAVSGKRRGR